MLLAKIFILLLPLTLLAASLSLADPVTIKFSHADSRLSPKGKASEYLKRLVEQRSNNRIRVEIYPNGSLFDDRDALEALKFNAIQMTAPSLTRLSVSNPQLLLFDLPFLFQNVEQLHAVIDGTIGRRMLEASSRNGLIALSFWDKGFKQFTANRRLFLPRDAVGLTFRSGESSVVREQFRTLDAIPQTVPLPQLYSSLEKGETDGQENTLGDIYNRGLYQVQSNLTISNHGYLGYMVLTNDNFWGQLPKDLKVIIQGAIKDAAEYTREMATQLNNDALKKIRATGRIKIHRLTPEERKTWENRLDKIYPAFYEKIGEKLVRKARMKQIR